MNCDQVFEILTRGPFPAGEPTDDAVERHLGACFECRQLAEALRPAVELFHEAVAPEEYADLPGYHGSLAACSSRRAPAVMTAVSGRAARSRREVAPRGWLASAPLRATTVRLTAAGALAAALCALLFGIAPPAGKTKTETASTFSSFNPAELVSPQMGSRDRERIGLVAALDLPGDCFRLAAASSTERRVSSLCCTRCHAQAAASSPHVPGENLLTITRACHTCHEG